MRVENDHTKTDRLHLVNRDSSGTPARVGHISPKINADPAGGLRMISGTVGKTSPLSANPVVVSGVKPGKREIVQYFSTIGGIQNLAIRASEFILRSVLFPNSCFSVCRRLSPFVAVCRHLSPFVAICRHLSPLVVACRRLSPFVAVCLHLSPFVSTCRRLSPLVATCHHLSPLVATCRHLSSLVATCLHGDKLRKLKLS